MTPEYDLTAPIELEEVAEPDTFVTDMTGVLLLAVTALVVACAPPIVIGVWRRLL